MAVKLTLNIDEDVINSAKDYALKKHISVSKLVEKYLKVISEDTLQKDDRKIKLSPITSELYGMIESKKNNYDYDKILEESLTEKYKWKKDFEDSIQNEVALKNNIETIITRNTADYKKSKLKIYTSEEFVNIKIRK